MFYTSYFAKLKSLPDNVVPISICAKAPEWYTGLQYKKLAPKYDFFMKWKENHDNDFFIECFNEQVLSKLNAADVVRDLRELAYDSLDYYPENIAFICYEKPSDFCHRQPVAKWLNSNGYECREYDFTKQWT